MSLLILSLLINNITLSSLHYNYTGVSVSVHHVFTVILSSFASVVSGHDLGACSLCIWMALSLLHMISRDAHRCRSMVLMIKL